MEGIEPDPVLGQPLANYPSDRLPPLIIAGAVGAPVALALGFTTAQVLDWWGPVLTLVIMALVVLALGWYVLHVWNREIILYERGFSYREGSNTIFFLYNEIASIRLRAERMVYFGVLRRNLYRFTVRTWRDERFTITNLYRRAAELGSRLTERINRVLQPEIARRLAKGEGVAFGDTLTFSVDGLRENGRDLSWVEFGGYQIGGRKLTLLNARGEVWYALPLSQVDNITLLLELLRERRPQDQSV